MSFLSRTLPRETKPASNTARPPKGIRPETREQLHRRLVENLTPEERDRVEVRVLDVRPPAARRAGATAI